jgi:MFS family permease
MDLTPLRRYREFRLLISASTISLFGSIITEIAAPLQMKQLTGSYVAVGLIGLVEFLPLMVFGLIGGAIADAVDRRRVVLLATCGELAMTALLLANALAAHPRGWVIYLAAAGSATATAIRRPSQDSLQARVVGHQDQAAANALVGTQYNLSAIVAPALGGVLASYNMPLAYAADIATFVVALLILVRLRPAPRTTASEGVGGAAIWSGLRYAGTRPDLIGTYAIDIVAMAFAMPEAVFPFLADNLHAPHALGLLYSAEAVGGVLVSVTSGWTARVHRHGVAIILAAATWGAGLALVGIVPGLPLVLLCLAVAGAGDGVSGIFRSTMWNQTIPDDLRGRMAGIELLSYTSGPSLGNARAGWMGHLGGVRFSIGVGGLLCLGGVAVTALALPRLVRYDDRTDPNAQAERRRRESQHVT